MTTFLDTSPAPDSDLVARSLTGDRHAFRLIVQRYQSLICALTYSACGNLHLSEDLAQETFLQAWKHLDSLRDRATLRPWLCGIARNLAASARRNQTRTPASLPQPDDDALPATTPTPPDEAISHEQAALLWQNLERLPDDYREPMVLFYRHQESVAAVATALDISQDAARQRLSRGRALLAQRLERLVRDSLRTTGPQAGFALAVIAALPGITLSAKAATLGAAAKGAASAKAASLGLLATSFLGPLIGIAGGYLGYRIGLAQTIAPEERRFMRRFFWGILALATAFAAALFLGIFAAEHPGALGLSRTAAAICLVVFSTLYAAILATCCFWYSRRIRQLRARILAQHPEILLHAQATCDRWNLTYRSPWTFLGLPLIHVNMGGSPDSRTTVAKGWIAFGAKAYGGLFAAGGLAIAPISFGGFSIGLITWGGFALGAVVFAGFGLGLWSSGGVAAGWQSLGGLAVAWSAAQGGVALAHDFAQGGLALAPHANDQTANAFFAHSPFFQAAGWFLRYAQWCWLIALLPLIPLLRKAHHNRPRPANH